MLAGGQSSRMGRDKALLELGGRTLIERSVERLRSLGMEPRICGSGPEFARFAPLIPDNFPGCGPLAGIEAALAASDATLNLFLAVDLPLLPAEFLSWMLQRAENSGAAATVPVFAGRLQPLCAVYSRRMAGILRQWLMRGDYKVMRAIEAAADHIDAFQVESVAAALAEGVWPFHPPLRDWFRNLNSPQDYESLRTGTEPGAIRRHPIS